jgi:hypothetical protein
MAYPYSADPAAPYAGYSAPAAGADPYAYSYGGGYAPASHPDEIRTLFITGFPPDVKERELNNMLRFLPGYEVSG